MIEREPVQKDCFKVKKGLCVTGNSFMSGNLTVDGTFQTESLSAGRIFSSNHERVIVPFGPDYTIIHPLSVINEITFIDNVQMEEHLYVKGDLRVEGDTFLSTNNEGSINVGTTDTDLVVIYAKVDSDIIPSLTDTHNLGSAILHWNTLFTHDVSAHNNIDVGHNLFVHGITTLSGALTASSAMFDSDVHIKGDLRVDGNTYLSASSDGIINVGDSNTDIIVFNADVNSHITPDTSTVFDLGSSTQQWREVFVRDISATGNITLSETLTVSGDVIIGSTTTLSGILSAVNDAKFDEDVHIAGDLRVDGDVWFNANNINGTNTINLGDDNTDNVIFYADVRSSIIPDIDTSFDLGSNDQQWNTIYTQDLTASNSVSASDLFVTDMTTLSSTSLSGVSDTPMLRVAQLGTGNALEILDQSDPDNTPFIINHNGRVGIGKTIPIYPLDVQGYVNIKAASSGTQPPVFQIENTGSNTALAVSGGLSSNSHVNFPNLSAGGLSGNFVSIQTDGEVTTSTVSVDAINQVATIVNNTSAEWDSVYSSVTAASAGWDDAQYQMETLSAYWAEQPHIMTRGCVALTTATAAREFITLGTDNPAGDSVWDDITYAHAMTLPYDAKVRKVVLRAAASQGAEVTVGIHSNRAATDTNTVPYKYFAEAPIATATQTFTDNNAARVFTFTPTTSAPTGRTFGISVSADQPIGETMLSIALSYTVPVT